MPGPSHGKGSATGFKIEVTCSESREWITISSVADQSLQGIPLALNLASPDEPAVLTPRYITQVRVDKQSHSIPDVYENYIEKSQSNLQLYYAFHSSNISTYLADKVALYLMWSTSLVLVVLLVIQVLLFLVVFYWQPEGVTEYFEGDAATPLTFVDGIANRFSIPMGFFGTVVSIWYSLESGDLDYGSFRQVLDAMRVAGFTTVMGLFIKILCLFRGSRRRWRQSS